MPIARRDVPLILMSAVIVIVAGLLVAGAFLFLLDSGETADPGEPVRIGLAESIRSEVEEGGPFFVADPTGGQRAFWIAEEDGELVALAVGIPDREDCTARWKGRDETFVDCDDVPVETTELDRYRLSVSTAEDDEGALLVHLDTLLPAPLPPPAT